MTNRKTEMERLFVTVQEQLEQRGQAYPEMVPLLIIRVEAGGHE